MFVQVWKMGTESFSLGEGGGGCTEAAHAPHVLHAAHAAHAHLSSAASTDDSTGSPCLPTSDTTAGSCTLMARAAVDRLAHTTCGTMTKQVFREVMFLSDLLSCPQNSFKRRCCGGVGLREPRVV